VEISYSANFVRECQALPSEKVGEFVGIEFLFLLGLNLVVGEVVEAEFKLSDKTALEPIASPFAFHRLERRALLLALLPKIHADGRIHSLIEVGTLEKSTILIIDMKHNRLKFHSFRLVLQQLHNLVVV